METKELEFESRALLNESQYKEITKYFLDNFPNNFKKFDIYNDYFETDNKDLFKNKLMLRVRRLESQYDFTLKVPLKDSSGDTEHHQYLDETAYKKLLGDNIFPDGEIKNIISGFNITISQIKYKKSLHCNRLEFYIDEFIIVLDKNEYGNIIDFNIEIESTSLEKSVNKNLELSKMFSYEFKDKYRTKFIRVLESMD